jgi:cell division initiation protein
MEVSSAREIEAALRERLDTESIAVVREAAAQQEPAEEAGDQPAEPEGPAFGTTAGPDAADAADLDDPGATRPIETVPSEDAGTQGTGPLADEPQPSDEETQVIGQGQTVTFGPEGEESQTTSSATDAPAEEPVADDSVATEPETEPSAASDQADAPTATTDEPGAAEEVDREEPTLAEESRSHEFFDKENTEEQKDSRISRASRFLRRRD